VVRKLKSILILAIGLGLAYWFISRLDWQTVGLYLSGAKIWPLILGAVLVNLTLVARSLRWQALLSPIAQVSLRNLFAATAVGFGSIFVIGRAGEIVRPAVLSLREKLRPSATLATILIERVFDMTAVVTAFAINLLFFHNPIQQDGPLGQPSTIRTFGLLLLAGVIVGIGILILLRLKAVRIIGWLEGGSGWSEKKALRPLINFIHHLADGLSVLLNLRALAVTVFYTVCVWGLVAAATWLAVASFGQEFTLSQVVFILGFALFGSIVPTPGGSAGAFHAVAAKGFELLGLEPNLAASIALVYHLIAFGPPFFIALYFLVRDDITLKQLRETVASEGDPHAMTQRKAGVAS
jgi:glycosyltransferase 2 family protein